MTDTSPFLYVADMFDRHATSYRNDRVAWVNDCIDFKRSDGLTEYQAEILTALDTHDRVAVRGPHGIGKTFTDAMVIWHWICTSDLDGVDWKAITTASAWRQLTHYLWPEVRKWSRRIRWDKVGRRGLTRFELLQQTVKLPTGEAFPVASDDPTAIEGAHADWLLYVLDEAKRIMPGTWDAIEGAFSGGGPDTAAVAKALANSTPGIAQGRFYDIHSRAPGYEDWHCIHVTLEAAIKAKRISRQWADQRARQWGEQSPMFLNRVLGEFSTRDLDGVIPLEWVELAQERWREIDDANAWDEYHMDRVSADIARGGADKTMVAVKSRNVIKQLHRFAHDSSTVNTANHIEGFLSVPGVTGIIDADGVGAGVYDQLADRGYPVFGFVANRSTDRRDKSGVMRFANTRAAAWWNLREMLDPDSGDDVALPPDDELVGDLCTPRYREVAGGRIAIERKEDIAKRLGRDDETTPRKSTDAGDTVVMAFWQDLATMGSPSSYTPAAQPVSMGITGDLLTAKW